MTDWTKGTFTVATSTTREPRMGYTLGRALGIHKTGDCYTLTDLHSGRRLTAAPRLKDAKALGLKLADLYDEDGRWHDLDAAKARLSAVLATWERGTYAPDGDLPTSDEVKTITQARRTTPRDEHIIGAHTFTPVTPTARCTTQDFLRWLSYRYNAAVHPEPYRVTFRIGWIDYTMRIVSDPLAWPLWLEEVIPQLARACDLTPDAVYEDITATKSLT